MENQSRIKDKIKWQKGLTAQTVKPFLIHSNLGDLPMDSHLFRLRILDLFEYDREAGKLFWKVSTGNKIKIGQEAGTINGNGYRLLGIDGKKYLTHRLIFLIEHGYLPEYIDHIDGNPLNNKLENLRECSRSENARNRSKQSNNTSGVVGVSWHKSKSKWHALCRDKYGKLTHLGYFADLKVAAEVVKAFRLEHHGQFAADLRHK